MPEGGNPGQKLNERGGSQGAGALELKSPPAPTAAFLSAVVCPLMPRELPLALANFDVWEYQMPPLTAPLRAGETLPKLVFSFSSAFNTELDAPLRQAFAEHPKVAQSFSGVDVLFLDLPPEKDLYVRVPTGPTPPYGFKAGPNWMFYETMRALRPGGGFVLLMETDCQPLVPNWLGRLRSVVPRHADAWIVGGHYCGASPLHWSIARHVNGNALYHVGDPQFWKFLDEFFWEWMHDYIRTVDPSLAYDCAWESFLNRPEMENPGHPHWQLSRDVVHRFRLTPIIVNIGGPAEQAGHYMWTRAQLLKRFPTSLIAHGPVVSDNAHARGRVALGRQRAMDGAQSGPDRIDATLGEKDAVWERSIWTLDAAFTPGDTLTVRFAIAAGATASVVVMLRDASNRVVGRKGVPAAPPDSDLRRAKLEHVVDSFSLYLRIEFHFRGDEGTVCTILEPRVSIVRGEEQIARNVALIS